MRACRSSIMVGKPLDKARMQRVLQHLSELDSPWNCPHGRCALLPCWLRCVLLTLVTNEEAGALAAGQPCGT